MIVGFILKKRGSLSQIDSPPNTTTSTSVSICMTDSVPVSAHCAAVQRTSTGTNTSVAPTTPL